ncbi:metal-dependent hydrolase [Candidatus Woesearchaeota archaeon]|nr:metal-dependent hydrolase [Candidatus Woesearchaeota archaeon]
MLARTHVCFALLLAIITDYYFSFEIPFWWYATIMIGCSFLPDIDIPTSKLGKRIKLVGYIFEHRGIFHTIWPMLFMFYILNKYFSFDLAASAIMGYFSHLLLDMLTPKGIQLFYPLKLKIRGFIETGSFLENIVCIILLMIDAGLVLYLFSTEK